MWVKRSICRNLNKMGRKTLASSCYRPCGIQLTSRPESSRWSKSVSCWTVHYWKHKARLRREALATWQQKLFETSASKGSALCRILVLSVFCTKMGIIEWDLYVCPSVILAQTSSSKNVHIREHCPMSSRSSSILLSVIGTLTLCYNMQRRMSQDWYRWKRASSLIDLSSWLGRPWLWW